MKKGLMICCLLLEAVVGAAYTRQDTLRGSNGRGRDWWDVVKYDLWVRIDTNTKTIVGSNEITFHVLNQNRDSMQIDLQEGLILDEGIFRVWRGDLPDIDDVIILGREGNVYWIKVPESIQHRDINYTKEPTLNLKYHGQPRLAKNAPWDGGFIWTKDSMGKPWIAVACQGLGASSWWPCKDYQGDEPDSGMAIAIDVRITPQYIPLAVSNGIMDTNVVNPDTYLHMGNVIYNSKVRNPINTYSTTFYIGDYAHWHDTLHGEKGTLDLDFYPLKYNEAKARKQWAPVKEMLRCFEYWMGPYPFYEDGYKLVEAPYLGMEHQSAIAYGNGYQNGYNGRGLHIDRSGTGIGFAFDFIMVHESGHEWFGNSITAQDIADNWLHEGFTTYTEALFVEWIKGRDSAFAYTTGEWKNIKNDRPVIGDYGVSDDGSSDKYDKGAAVVHMIRLMINDDKRFRELLRGLNRDFYHKIVSTKEVEEYISRFVGRDLNVFFDVYLRGKEIPQLVWKFSTHKSIELNWHNLAFPKASDIGSHFYFYIPFAVSIDSGRTFKIFNETQGIDFGKKTKMKNVRVKAIGLYNVVQVSEKEDIGTHPRFHED